MRLLGRELRALHLQPSIEFTMNGKKTYGVAVLMILHALCAYALGHDQALNVQEILGAIGLCALRAGVKKAERPESPPPEL